MAESFDELCDRVDAEMVGSTERPSDHIRLIHAYALWQGACAYDAILEAAKEARGVDTEPEPEATMLDLAQELEQDMECDCEPGLAPQRVTGHTVNCRIHIAAAEAFRNGHA